MGPAGPGRPRASPGTRPVSSRTPRTPSPPSSSPRLRPGTRVRRAVHIHAAENAAEAHRRGARTASGRWKCWTRSACSAPTCCWPTPWTSTDAEIAALARTGTSVAHCPGLEPQARLRHRPGARLLRRRCTVGLGTDGAVSSSTLDVLGAMRLAALVHKAVGDPTAVGAEQAVRMATIEGARALGLGDRLGSLEVGKRADLSPRPGAPHLRPRHDPWSTLAYAAHSADVRDTVVDGRVLMRRNPGHSSPGRGPRGPGLTPTVSAGPTSVRTAGHHPIINQQHAGMQVSGHP